jgi:hypothetical protein
MGLQVSCPVRVQTASESHLWADEWASGCHFPRAGGERRPDHVEGYLMVDHVHMCITIPPKHSVAWVIGFLNLGTAVSCYSVANPRAVKWMGECSLSPEGLDCAAVGSPAVSGTWPTNSRSTAVLRLKGESAIASARMCGKAETSWASCLAVGFELEQVNKPLFGAANLAATSSSFGAVTTQTNNPRYIQRPPGNSQTEGLRASRR